MTPFVSDGKPDAAYITDEIVRLRDSEDPPFSFAQIAGIINARQLGLKVTADQVRDLYCARKVEGGIRAALDSRS